MLSYFKDKRNRNQSDMLFRKHNGQIKSDLKYQNVVLYQITVATVSLRIYSRLFVVVCMFHAFHYCTNYRIAVEKLGSQGNSDGLRNSIFVVALFLLFIIPRMNTIFPSGLDWQECPEAIFILPFYARDLQSNMQRIFVLLLKNCNSRGKYDLKGFLYYFGLTDLDAWISLKLILSLFLVI